MRISDWSSDVCSSDLRRRPCRAAEDAVGRPALPPCRTAGARRCPRPLPRLRDVARRRVAGAAHRYRPPLAREAQAVSSAAVTRRAVGHRDTFVARFGGVFEHPPWIAAAAFDSGLPAGPPPAARLNARTYAALRQTGRASGRERGG